MIAGPDHTGRAPNGLDAGIARLGPLVTLIQYAIGIERSDGRHQQALERIDTLPDKIRLQPTWLAIRGDILRDIGDIERAWKQSKPIRRRAETPA